MGSKQRPANSLALQSENAGAPCRSLALDEGAAPGPRLQFRHLAHLAKLRLPTHGGSGRFSASCFAPRGEPIRGRAPSHHRKLH